MCRNITTLRGLEPPASPAEVEAAALQYVRKVAGISALTPRTDAAVRAAVEAITAATTQLLSDLPPRRVPPATVPPMRRHHGRP